MTPNTPRHAAARPGVESYFLRANHPTEPRAVWLKATVRVPDDGEPVAEAWAAVFDGDRAWASKHTVPLARASFVDGDPVRITVGDCRFELGPTGGRVVGALQGARGTTWDLRYAAIPGLGDPLCPYPTSWPIDGRFPKSKLLSPVACATFSGTLDGAPVTDWVGMQGHNWGATHAHEYVWGQAAFLDATGAPHALCEGFTGRIKLGPVVTPPLSALIVRRGGREYRFDRVLRPWAAHATTDGRAWTLRVRGADGEAALTMRATTPRMVCLGYDDPDGVRKFCLNSKLATVELRVNPADGDGFACTSPHGGALEFLGLTADPALPDVV